MTTFSILAPYYKTSLACYSLQPTEQYKENIKLHLVYKLLPEVLNYLRSQQSNDVLCLGNVLLPPLFMRTIHWWLHAKEFGTIRWIYTSALGPLCAH